MGKEPVPLKRGAESAMAEAVARSAPEPQGTADAAPTDIVRDRGFTVTRRRPMHPGRFMAFSRRWFGALSHETKYPGIESLSGTAESAPSSQSARGRIGWIGGFCKRRQPPVPISAAGKTTSREVLLCQPCDVPPNGRGLLRSATGTVWFVNSDDRRATWVFEAPSSSAPSGRHRLQCGTPWELGELGHCGEAGERRTSLSFVLRHSSDDMEEIADETLSAVETRLRKDMEACFLTRAEAAALDAGDNLDGMAEWETLRSMQTEMASFAANWLPALTALEAIVGLISAIPGVSRVAAVGEAISDRASRALGHVPDHPGHSDDAVS